MAEDGASNSERRKRRDASQTRRRIDAAHGYLMLEMPGHALEELKTVADASRHPYEMSMLRGDSYRRLGRYDDAIRAYTRALAERPDSLPVLMSLATCYRELGELDRAVTAMEDANRLHPGEPAVPFTLSRLYALAGNVSHALMWLRRAVRLCPEIANFAEEDRDFAPLTAHPHFRQLLQVAEARQRV